MNKILSITAGFVMSVCPIVASAQSYENYRQAADGYRPAQQPTQTSPRWDSINSQVLPPVRSFNRAASASSDDFSDNGYSSAPSMPEYQPEPQQRCGTGQVFIISPENTTTHNKVNMCQNEAGQWIIKR